MIKYTVVTINTAYDKILSGEEFYDIMAIIEHAGYYKDPMYGASHIHTSCEIMCVVEGKVSVTIDSREIHLSGGPTIRPGNPPFCRWAQITSSISATL